MPFDQALAHFERWHTDRWNRRCHVLGLLSLSLAAFVALRLVELWGPVDGGVVLVVGTVLFDGWWCPRLAPATGIAAAACWWLAGLMAPWALAPLLAVGALAQWAGHRVFEGNRPAFTENRVHLLVGPRWLLIGLLRTLGRRC